MLNPASHFMLFNLHAVNIDIYFSNESERLALEAGKGIAIKPSGASIIFINDQEKVLLFLRDNISTIKCPNMWDILGGNIEVSETPDECVVREMKEELGIDLVAFELFERKEFSDRTEYTFWKRENLIIGNIVLTEGQELRWFSREEAAALVLAFEFNGTIERFFEKLPFLG